MILWGWEVEEFNTTEMITIERVYEQHMEQWREEREMSCIMEMEGRGDEQQYGDGKSRKFATLWRGKVKEMKHTTETRGRDNKPWYEGGK